MKETENVTKNHAEEKRPQFFFQPKLTVNAPGDAYEHEADAMADKVMRMQMPASQSFFRSATALVQRKCQHCEDKKRMLHRKENSSTETQGSASLDSYVSSIGSSGQPMPAASRQFFEPRFGYDFSNVRIHTDSIAAKSAQSINALAYTSGNNIIFNQGQYAPGSESGQRLMAHELTHVLQQGCSSVARQLIQRTPGVDAADSFRAIMVVSLDQGIQTDIAGKTARRDEAIKRMLSTQSGAGLVNSLYKKACKGRNPCGKINIVFTDNRLACPDGSGCFNPSTKNTYPYNVTVGNVAPAAATRSRTLWSTWGAGPNAVTWHHSDPESAMANTLFHELLHISFVNSPSPNPLMPTGHNDAANGEIDPQFSKYLQDYNNQLDINEAQVHQQQGTAP